METVLFLAYLFGSLTCDQAQNTDKEKFFTSAQNPQVVQISKQVLDAYSKSFGGKRNLVTQVIKPDDRNAWFDSLDAVHDFIASKSPDLSLKLDILFRTSDYIFYKLDDVFKTEIVDAIVNEKDKIDGIKDIIGSNISIKKLDMLAIENKLNHGRKIYISMLADFKDYIKKYNGPDKKDIKDLLLNLIELIEQTFEKIQRNQVEIKNFINYQQTISTYDQKTLKMAYNLIGYKVGVKGLNEHSSPSEIFGLKYWEKNNLDHIKLKHKNLVNGFLYLKDNMDVPKNLYEIIVSILDDAMESLEQNFK